MGQAHAANGGDALALHTEAEAAYIQQHYSIPSVKLLVLHRNIDAPQTSCEASKTSCEASEASSEASDTSTEASVLSIYQRAELPDALMVVVEGFNLSKIFQGFLLVAHAIIAEGEHVLAVDGVLLVEGVLPDEQVGQRDSEVVHNLFFKDVLLAVVDELVEEAAGLILLT